MSLQLTRDWSQPRSSRSFIGHSSDKPNSKPLGTLVDCVCNTSIPCTAEGAQSFGKVHASITILGIVKAGWAYAPWKKPAKKNASREPWDPNSKNLFEEPTFADANGQRVPRSIKMYSYSKVENRLADKGPREDDTWGVITVGMTVHFQFHDFMFENKTYGENVFPDDIESFPPFSVVRVMLNAGHMATASSGYGMSIATVRPVDFTLYSYMYPLGLSLLPHTYDASIKFVESIVDDCKTIRNMVERTNVSFFARLNKGTFLAQPNPGSGWYKLVSEDGGVCDGVDTLDVSETDLLHFTNAGDDLGYAVFLVDLAASVGALCAYVSRNEYYCKQDSSLSCFRAAPLVDTEALLTDTLLSTFLGEHEEGEVECVVSLGEVPQLTNPTVALALAPTRFDGTPPTCPDFVLSSETVQANRGYKLTVSDRDESDILRLVFRSSDAGKRAGGYQRIRFQHARTA